MGQKSNILTLRKNLISVNSLSFDSKSLVQVVSFINTIKYLFRKKGVWITNYNINFENNKVKINLHVFYSSSKISYLKRKNIILKRKNLSVFERKRKILKIFDSFKLLRQNLFNISICNINVFINNSISALLYKKLKRFGNVLFSRRYNLFIDFIKITSLLIENKISADFYLIILSHIFKSLSKKMHNRFLFFLRFLFTLILNENKVIAGIKFVINGKLSGKPRSSSYCVQYGLVPNQSIGKDVIFASQHSYTLLGAFGLKIWIYKQ